MRGPPKTAEVSQLHEESQRQQQILILIMNQVVPWSPVHHATPIAMLHNAHRRFYGLSSTGPAMSIAFPEHFADGHALLLQTAHTLSTSKVSFFITCQHVCMGISQAYSSAACTCQHTICFHAFRETPDGDLLQIILQSAMCAVCTARSVLSSVVIALDHIANS